MKTEELIIVGLAGVALLLIFKAGGKSPVDYLAGVIKPAAAGGGFTSYGDGVVVGPNGEYYKNGVMVWAPGVY